MRVFCVMMQRNERDLLRPWVEYHAKLFGRENLCIFDNGSDDDATIGLLHELRDGGVEIDFSHPTRDDFNRKGEIIARRIREVDARGEHDFFFPLDCDEFVSCLDEAGTVHFDHATVLATLEPLLGDPRVLMIGGAFDNNPLHPDFYRFEPTQRKCFFAAGACGSLDIGFHWGRAAKTDETCRTAITYFHLHNRQYSAQQYFAKQKLVGRVRSFSEADLISHESEKQPGFHVVPELFESEPEFRARHAARPQHHLPQFSQALAAVGAPLSQFGTGSELPASAVKDLPARPPRGCIDSARIEGLTLRLTGWALDHCGAAAAVRGIVIGDFQAESFDLKRVCRPDVAAAQSVETLASGFDVAVSLLDAPGDAIETGDVAVLLGPSGGPSGRIPIPRSRIEALDGLAELLRRRLDIAARPGLAEESAAYFRLRLAQAGCYLEYGMGGTTVQAAETGVPAIVAVDSDAVWFDRVRHRIAALPSAGARHFIRADIGPTREWGFPVSDPGSKSYPSYALDAWRLCREQQLVPDLVLVDGRFRAACCLATFLFGKPGCRLLFDDYADRTYYHSVEAFLRPVRLIDRLAEFVIPADLPRDDVWLAFVAAISDPR